MATINCIYTLWPEYMGFIPDTPEEFGDTLASALLEHVDEGIIRYFCFQLEEGKYEHPHVQLYVQWEKKTRPDRLLRLLRLEHKCLHWDGERFGGRDAGDRMRYYCSKENGRLVGPWEGGEYKDNEQGARSDLRDFAERLAKGENLRDLARERPDTYVRFGRGFEALADLIDEPSLDPIEREVIVVVGASGSGKTHWVKATCKARGESCYQVPVNFAGGSFWLDGYRGQPNALLDDFNGGVPVEALLRLLHGWEERVPVKGRHTIWRPRNVYITTNLEPERWYSNITEEHWRALQRRITRKINYSVPDGGVPVAGPPLPVAEVARDNTSTLATSQELLEFGPGEMDIDEFLT